MGLSDTDIVALSGGHTLVCSQTWNYVKNFLLILFCLCTIGVCTYIYRGGAIRSVLDSRDPGPPTHLFSTTPISSKTHSAPEMFFPEMFFLDIILSGIQILMLDFASM
jgi:hypothetical protein